MSDETPKGTGEQSGGAGRERTASAKTQTRPEGQRDPSRRRRRRRPPKDPAGGGGGPQDRGGDAQDRSREPRREGDGERRRGRSRRGRSGRGRNPKTADKDATTRPSANASGQGPQVSQSSRGEGSDGRRDTSDGRPSGPSKRRRRRRRPEDAPKDRRGSSERGQRGSPPATRRPAADRRPQETRPKETRRRRRAQTYDDDLAPTSRDTKNARGVSWDDPSNRSLEEIAAAAARRAEAEAQAIADDDDLQLRECGVALSDNDDLLDGHLCAVVEAKIAAAARVAFDAGELHLSPGDPILVDAERGLTLATVLTKPERRVVPSPLPRVVRKIDPDDPRIPRATQHEQEAFAYCRQRIREHDLDMKLIRAEYLQSGNKILFYFAAEKRVDFRNLVRDLARRLHARIEMRQIGVRDESRLSGGLGPCGQPLCCASWIVDFQPVSIRMAKDQNLVLNPTKVSGMCGRLKCCLAYEEAIYKEARKALPKVGHRVITPAGNGRVHEIDIPRKLVRVLMSDGSIDTFKADECQRPT